MLYVFWVAVCTLVNLKMPPWESEGKGEVVVVSSGGRVPKAEKTKRKRGGNGRCSVNPDVWKANPEITQESPDPVDIACYAHAHLPSPSPTKPHFLKQSDLLKSGHSTSAPGPMPLLCNSFYTPLASFQSPPGVLTQCNTFFLFSREGYRPSIQQTKRAEGR